MYKTVKPTTFTLPLALLDELDSLAKDLGKKKTAIVAEALEMYMDFNDLKQAELRLAEKSIKADDFFSELGVQFLYALEFKSSVKKDFKHISKADIAFIKESLFTFVENFSTYYEQELFKIGQIKKLQGASEVLYRLKLRRYRVTYKKENNRLIILVLSVKSREGAYKK